MGKTGLCQYKPDYAVHPGEVLEEILEARNMKHADLAERCGLSPKTVSQIISGRSPISPETAIKLERVLGISASLWSNLDTNYRLFQAQRAARGELSSNEQWVKQFPLKELVKRGVIEPTDNIVDTMEQLLSFFGVASIVAWEERIAQMEVAFRKSPSFKSSPASVAAWLRIGELRGQQVECLAFNKSEFAKAVSGIRALTREQPNVFEPAMTKLCAKAGVALVFVAELHGTHLSGATRWLDSRDKALMILSLRHKTDDHFWFSFFHEAGHILLHGKKSVFIDEQEMELDAAEEQANQFAANTLVPRDRYGLFLSKGRYTKAAVESFAAKLGIAPGIVVGRLQFDKNIPFNHLNDLKRTFTLVEA